MRANHELNFQKAHSHYLQITQLLNNRSISYYQALNYYQKPARNGHPAASLELANHYFEKGNLKAAKHFAEMPLNHHDQNRYKQIQNLHYLYRECEMVLAKVKLEVSRRNREEQETRTAWHAFDNRTDLIPSIESEILPQVIRIQNGSHFGMGFFYHQNWLLSNAHVIPSQKTISNSILLDQNGQKIKNHFTQGYFRDIKSKMSPDIAMINLEYTSDQALSKLKDDRQLLNENIYFYIDSNFEMKFLNKLPSRGLPFIYSCEDGSNPQPGSSGSPIIKATIHVGETPQWYFEVDSILYARCSSDWYLQRNRSNFRYHPDTKLACSIPVNTDSNQVLNILREISSRDNWLRHAQAAKDLRRWKRANYCFEKAEQIDYKLQEFIKGYERGVSPLDINLPKGLERLDGNEIKDLSDSYLVDNVLEKNLGNSQKRTKKIQKKLQNFDTYEASVVKEGFFELLSEIEQRHSIKLQARNNFIRNDFFRLDVEGNSRDGWLLKIQDNTGIIHIGSQPLSSDFAIVRIENGCSQIDGSKLSELLSESQTNKENLLIEKPFRSKNKTSNETHFTPDQTYEILKAQLQTHVKSTRVTKFKNKRYLHIRLKNDDWMENQNFDPDQMKQTIQSIFKTSERPWHSNRDFLISYDRFFKLCEKDSHFIDRICEFRENIENGEEETLTQTMA